MKNLFAIGVLLGSLLLSACTQDVVIRSGGSTVNVGKVVSEDAMIRVEGKLAGEYVPMGVYELNGKSFSKNLEKEWAKFDPTAMLGKDVDFDLYTSVFYIGDRASAIAEVDKVHVTCPDGMMIAACISYVERTERIILETYRRKYSFL
ncbi:hypothetical protein vBPFY1MI_108 [Pseudomonas phage vB_PF_Y1-MI]|nr:hypothetical protein vBPFY1MI_108 [Pseudomonas phage vB_PF_Y1-MI]